MPSTLTALLQVTLLAACLGCGVVNAQTTPLLFEPLIPCRVLDTRITSTYVSANTTLTVPFTTSTMRFSPPNGCDLFYPLVAVSLNITVVPHGPLGYLTAWPNGESKPLVSTLNSLDGRVKANAAIVPVGTDPSLSINFYASNDTDLIVDLTGEFVDASVGLVGSQAFYPVSPCRIADTRNAIGTFGGPSLASFEERDLPIPQSACNIPSDSYAFSLNVTVVPINSSPVGYLTVWPNEYRAPIVSTLNAPTGQVTANAALVEVGTYGNIAFSASNDTNLVVDVNGYFAAPGTGGLHFYTVTACRTYDSRTVGSQLPFTGAITVPIAGTCGIPATAAYVAVNATVVPSGPLGYLTLWASGLPQPSVSTLNADDGTVTSNLAIVPLGAGAIDAFASNSTHLVLDVSGYFAP